METIFTQPVQLTHKTPSVLWLSALVGLGTLAGMVFQARFTGELTLHHWQPTALRLAPLAAITAAALLGSFFTAGGGRAASAVSAKGLARLRGWNRVIFVLVFTVFPAIVLSPLGARLDPYVPRFWLFAHLAFLGALFCQAGWKKASYLQALAVTVIAYGVAYQIVSYFPTVNNYPLTLGWSEASRYYYASLFFARSIYGEFFALPTLHPSRYLLQSIPFLIPSLPIVAHRLWQVLLWVGLSGAAALLLARRLRLKNTTLLLVFSGWAYLFLMQGPVYYHLAVCAILVLWGFDRKRPWWRSLGVVALASAWAGISRVNWLPVPGLLAAALYLLETPQEEVSPWRYLLPPTAWTVAGLGVGYAVQQAYIPLSGAPAYEFGSSFNSSLLWYRLFPSATYSTGVLLGILLAAGPLAAVILESWFRARRAWNAIRVLGLAAILGALFAEGIVVSVKIGGGSNLHNLDAFLVFLLVTGSYFFFDRFAPDRAVEEPERWVGRPGWALLGLLLALPLLPTLQAGGPVSLPPATETRANLAALQGMISAVPPGGGKILFISERQLVTFGQIQVRDLEPDYETVFLMEMAMADQPDYLGKFESDLRAHRFALIVTAPLNMEMQSNQWANENDFAEENNTWVEHVSRPILKEYQVKARLGEGIQVLVPKAGK
ncbi:MAG TPA: hypothetical protein VMT46_18455 [Anaerolineaceae bacterium]|nr:hypothetical protein [Anaerolineaceae bacterium]